MKDHKPLLSICIPTYNRAPFLKVMLQALLPQVAEFGNDVEVIISDNASTDNTENVVNEAKKYGHCTYSRNNYNEGVTANIFKCPLKLAHGEFIWILGDHNLANIGSIRYLLGILKRNFHLRVLNVNFQRAKYPSDWPNNSLGGYDGNYLQINNSSTEDKPIIQWHELIKPETAMCTQLYSHIVKTQIWKDFWNDKTLPETLKGGDGTYPHTFMLIHTVLHEKSFYIGKPLITIFSGAQHWLNQKNDVLSKGLPEIILALQAKGINKSRLRGFKRFNKQELLISLKNTFNENSVSYKVLFKYLKANNYYFLIPTFIKAFFTRENSVFSKFSKKISFHYHRMFTYFQNWRPARWFKARKIS